MTATTGRQLKIKKDGTLLAAVQSKSVSNTLNPIDITSDDSDAWRTLLGEPGSRSMDIPVSGILTDAVLLDEINAATTSVSLQSVEIEYPLGSNSVAATSAGDFFLANFNITGEHDGSVTFDATLQSSGEITYTAATP